MCHRNDYDRGSIESCNGINTNIIMKLKFKAIKKNGGKYDSIRESTDKFTLYEELKTEGDTLISASEITKPKFEIIIPFLDSVPEHQKIIFSKNLGSMINAGLSLSNDQ